MLTYARFLKQIVNNDREAVLQYEKALHVFTRFITLKVNGNGASDGNQSGDNTEHLLFGENTAAAIVVASLDAERLGVIMHTNEEMFRLLGYQRKQLINKKINLLMPLAISESHDNFIRKFLETAKRNVLNRVS